LENIVSNRLIIRKLMKDDWKDLYEYLCDKEVVKFEPYDVYSENRAKEEAIARASSEFFYAVCLKESGKLIGNLYLGKGDFDTWDLGYELNRKYQGQGYATESVKALLDYAFAHLGARRIISTCSPNNNQSWKLLERLGMRREGHLLQNVYFKTDSNGEPIWLDTYEYAILKTEWYK
jgi:RimJ/RimL family protein N-acetyltransferase